MTVLAQDANSNPIQAVRPGSTQLVASTGTASSATAVADGVDVVRIIADAAIHYDLDGTATTSSVLLPANTVEYIHVYEGDVISLIGTANVHITACV